MSTDREEVLRLRRISASDTARIAELTEALRRQADNMAWILNHVSVPDQWYAKFTAELEEDRAVLEKPPTPPDLLDTGREG